MTKPDPARGKGGRLTGGALSEEALASSARVLARDRGGRTVGLQQHFTPPEAASLIAEVVGRQGAVLDPTAGSGALLAPWPAECRFGVEIDPDWTNDTPYQAIAGDIQRVYALLRLTGARFDVVVTNPPFGLSWEMPDGRRGSSTEVAFCMAMGLCERFGEVAVIAGRDRFRREVEGRDEARGVWATVEVPDLFEGVDLPCIIAFAVGERTLRADPMRLRARRNELPGLAERLIEARRQAAPGVAVLARSRASRDLDALCETFRAVAREHERRRGGRPPRGAFDASLSGGRVRTQLSSFAQVALNERGELQAVRRLHRQPVSYFGLNRADWRLLSRAAEDGILTLDPRLAGAVAQAREEAERELCPLYPLPPQQRLGWLGTDEEGEEEILCTRGDPERGYEAGARYPVRTRSRVNSTVFERPHTLRDGEVVLRRVRESRKVLEIAVGEHVFSETPEDIAYLVERFEIPDPGSIEERMADELARARQVLREIAAENRFSFRPFQIEDTARLLVRGKGLAAVEVGLGKTLMAFALAEGHRRLHRMPESFLYVTAQDLIPQARSEAAKFFGRDLCVIDSTKAAREVARRLEGGEGGWFVTHYEALSLAGRRTERLPERTLVHPADYYRLTQAQRERSAKCPHTPQIGEQAREAWQGLATSKEACRVCATPRGAGFDGTACSGCGHVDLSLRTTACARILGKAFSDGMIALDEVSLIASSGSPSGNDFSLRTLSVCALRARYRYGFSGTPLRNFVVDLHPQLWWIWREGPNFPYPLMGGREKWVSDFAVVNELYGVRAEDRHRVTRRQVLPEVTNLSRLWRLLASATVRRRKDDTGEPLVPRVLHEVTVPAGQAQLAQQRAWLLRFPAWFSATHPESPLVRAGQVERFAAALGQLPKLDYAASLPEGDPDASWTEVPGVSNFTPKNLKVLEIALDEVRAGKKVVVFSNLVEHPVWIAERLRERGVDAVDLTELRQGRRQTKGPRRRGDEIARFTRGDAQVLCATVQAIRLGHNFDMAEVAILAGIPWSYEQAEQALGRVHRLTSRRPVSVHVVMADFPGSMDTRRNELVVRKGATSDLVFDGELASEQVAKVNWQRELEQLRARGVTATGDEVAEDEVRAIWERAQGELAPLRVPAGPAVIPGQERLLALAGVAPPAGLFTDWDELLAEEESGQIALAIAA